MLIAGLMTLIMVIFFFLLAYGFLKGLRWSWFLGVIIVVIGIIECGSVTLIISFWSSLLYPSEIISYNIILRSILSLVIYGLILFYLTRAHVRTYFGIGQPCDVSSTMKGSKKAIAFILAALVVIAGILIWGFTPSEINIIGVTQTPENPQPGDEITVIAEISGGSPFFGVTPRFEYSSYFGEGGCGGGTMTSIGIGSNKYSYTIRSSFVEGTGIWYMIGAGDKISREYITLVGHVERSNMTSLAITDVIQTPEKPTTATTSVQIRANVTSNATVSEVTLKYIRFYEHGGGTGSGSMHSAGNDSYEGGISLSKRNEPYKSGTQVFYRITAKDESGNTAVTPVYTFRLT